MNSFEQNKETKKQNNDYIECFVRLFVTQFEFRSLTPIFGNVHKKTRRPTRNIYIYI